MLTNDELRKLIRDYQIGAQCYPSDYTYHVHRETTDALTELLALREQTRWIPVAERVPDTNRIVEACNSEGVIHACFSGNEWQEWTIGGFDCMGWNKVNPTVTYWREIGPLPESGKDGVK